MSDAAESEEKRRDRAERADLRARVDALEGLALRVWTATAAAVLILGAFVPFGSEERTDGETGATREQVYSIVASIAAMGEGEEAVLFGVGFLGLTLCTLVAVITLFAMWQREGGRALSGTATAVAVLMAIGAVVPLVMSGMLLAEEEAGPGALIFVGGVILYIVTLNPPFTRLWKQRAEAGR